MFGENEIYGQKIMNIDEKNRTSNPKIFAGGDIAGAKGTVAWAARSGRDAADSIMRFLNKI